MVKKMVIISLAIIAILVLGTVLTLYLPKTGYSTSTQTPEANPSNIFSGKITNSEVSLGSIEGITTYDRGCNTVDANGLTECDAGIKTDQYGELNFHYKHNMNIQPCLDMYGPEKVIVDILDSNGDAKITRTIDASSMGMHHG